jgi:hypothetical protein
MHETHGWFLDAHLAKLVTAGWVAVVVLYGLWRSRGAAAQDTIRESGPIF